MITNPETIQSIITGMENTIKANTEYINLLAHIKAAAKEYDNKIINKRFTDLINIHLPDSFKLYDYKLNTYSKSYAFTIYQRDRYSENYSKSYCFPVDTCFATTENGKHRVKASGFTEQCTEIRTDLINENIKIRNEINQVYQMLADAQALYEHAKQYESKYSYSLKSKFKCDFYLRNH